MCMYVFDMYVRHELEIECEVSIPLIANEIRRHYLSVRPHEGLEEIEARVCNKDEAVSMDVSMALLSECKHY